MDTVHLGPIPANLAETTYMYTYPASFTMLATSSLSHSEVEVVFSHSIVRLLTRRHWEMLLGMLSSLGRNAEASEARSIVDVMFTLFVHYFSNYNTVSKFNASNSSSSCSPPALIFCWNW